MMLQANSALDPDQVKNILQETATPMLGYTRYEVGAGYLNAYAAVRKAAFGTRYGAFRSELSPAVTFTHDPVVQFGGTVAPGQTYSLALDMPFDASFATVQVGWLNSRLIANNLSLAASVAGQAVQTKPSIQIAGPAFKKTGVTINNPIPGSWTITVTNTTSPLLGSSQSFAGAIEIFRANLPVSGLDQLSPSDKRAARQVLLTGLMTTDGDFAADSPATRLEVARAVALGAGARVPQYLPYCPTYTDVPNNASAVFVESVAHSPRGDLMVTSGSEFNPQAESYRLTVAVAMIKSLGLSTSGQSNPGLADWFTIPSWARPYVSLAITRGLMSATSGYFRPFDSVTRRELAKAAFALQQSAR